MLTTIEKIVFLQKAPIFEQMTSRQLKVLSEVTEEENFAPQETVFAEGSIGDRMYIIIAGQVEILKSVEGRGGTMESLAVLEKREIFGEMAILDDDPRSAAAVVREPARLLSIRKANVRELIHDYPDIAFGIFKVLSGRIREANRQIELLQRGDQRKVVITVIDPPESHAAHTMVSSSLVLGRPESSEMLSYDKFSIPDQSQEISRRHAELVFERGQLFLRDLESLNGTWVGGRRLAREPAPLQDGATFRLGSRTELRVNWK
jgi:CRP/FNR family transcriptional regulator